MSKGVDGIKVSDINVAAVLPDWSKVQAAIQGNRTDVDTDTKKR